MITVWYKLWLNYVDDSITHAVRELCKLRDHVNMCELLSPNMIHVLLGDYV